MGIQINGNNDIISALDGSWTAEGASINTSGILTATTFVGNITGTAATFTGPVTIGGTLTYEDVTNIDSVGIVTARSGLKVTGGQLDVGSNIKLGNAGVVTATSFVGGLPITNGADNRVITASSASAIQGESGLTYSGGTFQISANSPQLQITESDTSTSSRLVMSAGRLYIQIAQQGQGSSTSAGIMYLTGYNNTTASEIHLKANNTYNTGHFHLEDAQEIKIGNSDDFRIYHSTDNYIKSVGTSQNLIFDVNSGERLRITSTGLVGIGTEIPVGNLEVRDSKANLIVAKDGLPVKSNSDLAASYDMIQLGAGGALASYSATSVTADTMFIHNAYRHSGNNWKRRYQDTAARMRVNSPANTWIFETAATGSADSDITSWDQSLRITSGGVLCVGATAADGDEFLRVKNKLLVMNTANTGDAFVKIKAGESGGSVLEFEADEGDDYADLWRVQNAGDGLLGFRTKASGSWVEKLRIDSSGRLGVGNVAPADYYSGFDDLVIKTSGNSGITIVSGTSSQGTISFADGTSGDAAYRGYVQYSHTPETLAFGAGGTGTGGDRAILSKYGMFTLESGSQDANSKPGIELKSTGYTGNITRLFQDSPNAQSVLETTERPLLFDIDSGDQVAGTVFRVDIDGDERYRINEHGTYVNPTTGGDSVNTKSGGRFYTISGATPLDGTNTNQTETPLMRCGHSFNGTMRIWMAFGGDEFHNGCRQYTFDCQGTYGYVDLEEESAFNNNALGAGLNSLVFQYQNAGSPNYYFKVKGTWASGQNTPYILWSWTGHNSEYPYAL